MSKLNDLDSAESGIPFPPSRLMLHDHVQLYYSFCRAAPEDVLSSVTETSRPIVLLLAPGDTRPLLYTLYRNFDPEFRGRFEGASFLVNNNWSVLHARDILMLHLCLQLPHRIDSQEGKLLCAAIWAIFYSSTLRPPHVKVLKEALTALSRFGSSPEAWDSPENPLGRVVRFRNEDTFRAVVRHWERWRGANQTGFPAIEKMLEVRIDYLAMQHMTELSTVMNTYTERCVAHLLGFSEDSVPKKTQERMREEFSSFVLTGTVFAEDVLLLPEERGELISTNPTFFDGSTHSIQHNPFYGLIPFLGFFHSFFFSPTNCRRGNVPRSLCDKLPVADELFELHPLLANSVQQLALWLSGSSRALRKLTAQTSPCVTFTFECLDPISLCLRMLQEPELYTASLGEPLSFDVIHTFELVDSISPADLILNATPLLKHAHFLIATAVDIRAVGYTLEQYLGVIFGVHPQVFPVLYGIRCVGVEATFSDGAVPRHTAWNQAAPRSHRYIHTFVFQRVISTPIMADSLEEMGVAPKAMVSCMHATTFNFPANRYSHMMSMETVVTTILAFVAQVEADVNLKRWQFWDSFSRLVREERALVSYVQHLQTVALLHGLHLHITVNERDCPVCRKRPLSSYLSLFSVRIHDPVMIPHVSLGLYISREPHDPGHFLANMKETHIVHAVALRRDRDNHYFIEFFFPRKFAEDDFKLTVVKFTEQDLGGRKVHAPTMVHQGLMRDIVAEGSPYWFRQLPPRQHAIISTFGEMVLYVADCEKVHTELDVHHNLVYSMDCKNLAVDSQKQSHRHLCLKISSSCKYDIYFPYPIVFSNIRIEFHCRDSRAVVVATRDPYTFHTQSPAFVVTPTNRLFLPASPLSPSPRRDYLGLQLSPMEEDNFVLTPPKWVVPLIGLKHFLRDLFNMVSTCRFIHIHAIPKKANSKPELRVMIVVHDEVVDLDTRSPAVDLSFCFMKETGEGQTELTSAWAKITADHTARSLSLPQNNFEALKKMFDYFAGRTHTVYTENNRTSLCRIKVLRKHGVEASFTRAVVFPFYASPDKQIVDLPSGNRGGVGREEPEASRVPRFLAGVFSHGGVHVSEEVKRVIDALSPQVAARANSETRREGGVSGRIAVSEIDKVDTLVKMFQSSQVGGGSLLQMMADMPTSVVISSSPDKWDERVLELKKDREGGRQKSDMPAAKVSQPPAKPKEKAKERERGKASWKTHSAGEGENEKQKLKAREEKPSAKKMQKKKVVSAGGELRSTQGKEKTETGKKSGEGAVGGGSLGDGEGGKSRPRGSGREGVRSKVKCTNCGQASDHMKKCAGCGGPRYCSRECQRQHWRQHKPDCVSDDRPREGGRKEREPSAKTKPRPPPAQEMKALMLVCDTCGRESETLKRCKCVQAVYCNVECQRKDWPQHRLTCSAAPQKK